VAFVAEAVIVVVVPLLTIGELLLLLPHPAHSPMAAMAGSQFFQCIHSPREALEHLVTRIYRKTLQAGGTKCRKVICEFSSYFVEADCTPLCDNNPYTATCPWPPTYTLPFAITGAVNLTGVGPASRELFCVLA
jgi:hypothetical protein